MIETIPCDRCGGNGLVPVHGNAPAGTGRCPECHGLGHVKRPTEAQDSVDQPAKQQDSVDQPTEAMQEPNGTGSSQKKAG